MTTEKLRWCTIEGTAWMASRNELKFLIELSGDDKAGYWYVALFASAESKDGWDFIGSYDTLQEAQKECEEWESE